jgi:capsular polysaccharide transport system permease protein
MVKFLKNIRFLFLFLIPLILASFYVISVQTELYKSSTTVLIKDLKPTASASDMLSALIPNSSSSMQDSKLIEKYIHSIEMFTKIDKKFNLKKHYMSKELDVLQRKYNFSKSSSFFDLYKNRVVINYDELSSTLDIGFLYTDPKIAKQILEYIIKEAEKKLNMYDKENGNELLDFIKGQEIQNKKTLFDSIEALLEYQNKHKMIDPSMDIKSKSRIVAELEKQVIQKEIKYANLKQYMNYNSVELRTLKAETNSLKKKLNDIKSQLSGSSKKELNENLFEFERLKSDIEFNKERYKQTLIQLDMAMIQATQNAKNFIIITKPTLSDDYSSPDKLKNIITIFMILFMLYGIITMIYAIIQDHRD